MGRVELHERAQRHLEGPVGAGDGRAPVREGHLGERLLRFRLVFAQRLDVVLGGGLQVQGGGPQLLHFGRQRLHLRFQPLDLGLARIGRRVGRRGRHGAFRRPGPRRGDQGESAERGAGEQPPTCGYGVRNHGSSPLVLGFMPDPCRLFAPQALPSQ